jgi:hypothetical protein
MLTEISLSSSSAKERTLELIRYTFYGTSHVLPRIDYEPIRVSTAFLFSWNIQDYLHLHISSVSY